MILLPLFKYGKFNPKTKTDPKDGPPSNKDHIAALEAQLAAARAAGNAEGARMYALALANARK